MNFDEITRQADMLYEAKLRSGKYSEYPEGALMLLYEDCLRQVMTMAAINARR